MHAWHYIPHHCLTTLACIDSCLLTKNLPWRGSTAWQCCVLSALSSSLSISISPTTHVPSQGCTVYLLRLGSPSSSRHHHASRFSVRPLRFLVPLRLDCCSYSVRTKCRSSESNAMRLARGLPPNKTTSLYDPKKRGWSLDRYSVRARHSDALDASFSALRPRASVIPTPPLNNRPGGSCGCTFISQTDAAAQATGLYETSPQNSAQNCLNRSVLRQTICDVPNTLLNYALLFCLFISCDTSIDCQVGVFRSATSQCELYNYAVDSSTVITSRGDAYFTKFSCSGTCTPPPVYTVRGGNSCGCSYDVYAEVAAMFSSAAYDSTSQPNVAACIMR